MLWPDIAKEKWHRKHDPSVNVATSLQCLARWKKSVEHLGNGTAALERQRKSLAAKANEYQQELGLVSVGPSCFVSLVN